MGYFCWGIGEWNGAFGDPCEMSTSESLDSQELKIWVVEEGNQRVGMIIARLVRDSAGFT